MKNLLIYIVFIFVSWNSFTQTDSLTVKLDKNGIVELKQFDQSQLDSFKNDENFNYNIQEDNSIFNNIKDFLKRTALLILGWLVGKQNAFSALETVVTVLPYIVLIILIVLIVFFFLKIKINKLKVDTTEKADVILTEEAEIIKNADISSLIKLAIQQNNYRLGIRYYYLLILQQLEQKELIYWEQQKTNEDYIQEIEEKTIVVQFKELTRLYDFVWYGNFEINELEFSKAVSEFNSLTKAIK